MAGFWNIPFYSVSLLIVCCYLSSMVCVYGEGEVPSYTHLVQMESLRPASTCISSSTGLVGGFKGVKVMNKHGPCSPLGRGQSNSLLKDQSRVMSINSKTSRRHSQPTYYTDTGGGNYIVIVGFGTPTRDFSLILDTGSDITWIQCQPCPKRCYSQKELPLFDPNTSSTYSSAFCSSSGRVYNIYYGDHSYSKGRCVSDTLTLKDSGVFPNIVFGCGQDNSQGFGKSAGVLGLSSGADSIVSQTSKFRRIFCYCLPSTEGHTGYLTFGNDALKACKTETSTPLLSSPSDNDKYYFVHVTGITIGNQTVSFPTSKTIIDSGTVISRLPSSVYVALQTEFKKLMSNYPPASPPHPMLLDTCYDLTGYTNVKIPMMTLNFEGSSVSLDPRGVVWWESDSQVCLGFASKEEKSGFNIIGNTQQRTMGVLYNLRDKKLSFRTNSCS